MILWQASLSPSFIIGAIYQNVPVWYKCSAFITNLKCRKSTLHVMIVWAEAKESSKFLSFFFSSFSSRILHKTFESTFPKLLYSIIHPRGGESEHQKKEKASREKSKRVSKGSRRVLQLRLSGRLFSTCELEFRDSFVRIFTFSLSLSVRHVYLHIPDPLYAMCNLINEEKIFLYVFLQYVSLQ